MDEKMEMFFDSERWKSLIQIGVDKKIDLETLTLFSQPEYRCRLYEAISSNSYNIAPPHIAEIPKDDGGVRKVFVNEPLDRLVLSLIGSIYSELYADRIHPCCVSYQKGIGVSKIIKSLSNKVVELQRNGTEICGYKIDISKYFDSYNKENLYADIDSLDTGSPIDAIVSKYYHENLIINEDGMLISYYKSIAQGCAVSPFIANYALRDVDEAIAQLDVLYYRYSDDAIFIGKDADKALETFKNMLQTKGLKLNPKKIEKILPNKWFTFLGFSINSGLISFSKKSIKNFQREIKLRTPINSTTKHNKKAVKKAIKDVNYYLYTAFMKSSENFGWGEYFFSTINVEADIVELDQFVKDRLRAMFTGKSIVGGLGTSELPYRHTWKRVAQNVGANKKKVSNDELRDYGYVSMNFLYQAFKHNPEVYRLNVNQNM